MKYLCLIYERAGNTSHLSPRELDLYVNEHLDYDDLLRARGQLVSSEALQFGSDASIVRVRQGKLSVTDGPFAETSELLGGYYLIETDSEEDALRIAADIPSTRFGSRIELRPVRTAAP